MDLILEQWARERPDIDASPMGVVRRIHRVGALLDAGLRSLFAGYGLGNGDFDVLAALRRAGRPYELSPTELSTSMMVTSGAATKRIDRLERAGLVSRSVDEDDARGRRVRLTMAGRRLVDRLVVQHVANEDDLLRALDRAERDQLAGLLSRLLVDLEDRLT